MGRKGLYSILIVIGVLVGSTFITKDEPFMLKEKQPKIGVLQFVSHPALDEIYQGFLSELNKQGYKDGKNIKLVFQNAQGDQNKLLTMSQYLREEKVSVSVGIATPSAQALANVMSDKQPVVLGAVSDPKAAGLVSNNEYPGGYITGVSDQAPVKEQIQLMKELLPNLKRVGILYSSSEDNSSAQVKKFKQLAPSDWDVKEYSVPTHNEIKQMTQVMVQEVEAIYIPIDNTIADGLEMVVQLADDKKVPIIPSAETMVEAGGLATVGINQFKLGEQTAKMTIDILEHKKKPGDMPIYTFNTGDKVINQKKAEELGIKIPKQLTSYLKVLD